MTIGALAAVELVSCLCVRAESLPLALALQCAAGSDACAPRERGHIHLALAPCTNLGATPAPGQHFWRTLLQTTMNASAGRCLQAVAMAASTSGSLMPRAALVAVLHACLSFYPRLQVCRPNQRRRWSQHLTSCLALKARHIWLVRRSVTFGKRQRGAQQTWPCLATLPRCFL